MTGRAGERVTSGKLDMSLRAGIYPEASRAYSWCRTARRRCTLLMSRMSQSLGFASGGGRCMRIRSAARKCKPTALHRAEGRGLGDTLSMAAVRPRGIE